MQIVSLTNGNSRMMTLISDMDSEKSRLEEEVRQLQDRIDQLNDGNSNVTLLNVELEKEKYDKRKLEEDRNGLQFSAHEGKPASDVAN
jgi:hypothetical protein